ncbi:NADPH-dependent FMN reductase [Aureococcus anophagefferens]|uniref:NADPH-dependent FMN reductase n=1 Tax=Aureococcus anophagefferens TaxID=44056 RepID=A0ABR1FMG1_AURAN
MRPLRVALLLGSTRDGPPRPLLGRRVGKYVEEAIARKGHAVDVVDPAVVDLPLTPFQPHFTYRDPPAPLQALAETFAACDALVACTPEYNHAAPVAGAAPTCSTTSARRSSPSSRRSSCPTRRASGAAFAPPTRFGRSSRSSRAASFAMIHVPKAGEAFDEDGAPREDADRWAQYADRGVAQLEWWATARESTGRRSTRQRARQRSPRRRRSGTPP